MPFPQLQECLGLSSRDSVMRIKEGYAVLAYDFAVESSHPDCLFNLNESSAEKSTRWAALEASKLSRYEKYASYFDEMSGLLRKQFKELPRMPDWARFDFQDLKDIDRHLGSPGQQFFEDSLRRIIGEGPDMFREIHVDGLKDIANEVKQKLE